MFILYHGNLPILQQWRSGYDNNTTIGQSPTRAQRRTSNYEQTHNVRRNRIQYIILFNPLYIPCTSIHHNIIIIYRGDAPFRFTEPVIIISFPQYIRFCLRVQNAKSILSTIRSVFKHTYVYLY